MLLMIMQSKIRTSEEILKMENNHIPAKVTLHLDEKWASNFEPQELSEYIKTRVEWALGFRGYVKKVKTGLPK